MVIPESERRTPPSWGQTGRYSDSWCEIPITQVIAPEAPGGTQSRMLAFFSLQRPNIILSSGCMLPARTAFVIQREIEQVLPEVLGGIRGRFCRVC
jgi:hypothetical protein